MFTLKALQLTLILRVASLAVLHVNAISRGTGKATLNLAARINTDGTLNFVERDWARARAFRNTGHLDKRSKASNVDVTNTDTTYTAQVGIGDPPIYYTLLVDTGMSNTLVGANIPYIPTCTSQDTGNTFSVHSGTVTFGGEEWIDTITLGPDLVIANQSIGVINNVTGDTNALPSGFDGVLGLGLVDLTENMVSNTGRVPTVMDNLYSQGTIPEEIFGIYLAPLSESDTGTLTFGGYDDSVITSSVNYVPITTAPLASEYWGFYGSITYGGATILETTAGIVDIGTTFILIPPDALERYASTTGAVWNYAHTMLVISPEQYANLQPLSFNIGGTSYDLPPSAQILPRSLNVDPGFLYLAVNEFSGGTGPNFVVGYTFLERYYSVYDTTNNRIGFASTIYTNSTSY